MTQKQVKILRSVGTASGVFNQGAEPHVEEAIADSWVEAGFAEYMEEKEPVVPPVETSGVPPIEVAIDKPIETKTDEETPAEEKTAAKTSGRKSTKK